MELPKLLLSAILLGITVNTTSCVKDESKNVTPSGNVDVQGGGENHPEDCPACGMG